MPAYDDVIAIGMGHPAMDEIRFLALMKKARNFSHLGGRPDYWHGYQRGLRRGFQGELFGTGDEHERWMRLADEGADNAARERGRGYRDGLSAVAAADAAADGGALAGLPLSHGGDLKRQANRLYPSRR
jgi:hypothetical protein